MLSTMANAWSTMGWNFYQYLFPFCSLIWLISPSNNYLYSSLGRNTVDILYFGGKNPQSSWKTILVAFAKSPVAISREPRETLIVVKSFIKYWTVHDTERRRRRRRCVIVSNILPTTDFQFATRSSTAVWPKGWNKK